MNLVEQVAPLTSASMEADLVISLDPAYGVFEFVPTHTEEAGLQVALDAQGLVERIQQSTFVVVDAYPEPPDVLGRRTPEMTDGEWLTAAATPLIDATPDAALALQLVELALGRVLGTNVILARRPKGDRHDNLGSAMWFTGFEAGRLMGPASRRGLAGRATSGREVCFFESRHHWWTVVVPWRASRVDAQAVSHHPLLEAFAARLRAEDDERAASLAPATLRALIDAATQAMPQQFVETVATVVGGSVAVQDRDGEVLASTGRRSDDRRDHHTASGNRARDIVLKQDDRICGALTVTGPVELSPHLVGLLECLGAGLIASLTGKRTYRRAESQLFVVGCLTSDRYPELIEGVAAKSAERRRLAFVSTAAGMTSYESDSLMNRLSRACERQADLQDLQLVAVRGGFLGLYPAPESRRANDEGAWSEVLKALDPKGLLRVAVGLPVSTTTDARDQYRAIMQLSKVQNCGSPYFALPSVALVDHLGPLSDLLGRIPGQQLAPFVERVLGELIEDQRFGGQMLETLYAYLQSGGSPREAGNLLHLHASTVKYRMRVIRDLLGARLEDSSERFDLELAVRLCLTSRQILNGQRWSHETRRVS